MTICGCLTLSVDTLDLPYPPRGIVFSTGKENSMVMKHGEPISTCNVKDDSSRLFVRAQRT